MVWTTSKAGNGSFTRDDPSCLYCGGRAFVCLHDDVRDRLRYVPGRWSFHRCCVCGSALLFPFPHPSELATFYPPVYAFSLDLGGGSGLARILNWLEYRLFFRPQYESQVRRVLAHIRWDGSRGLRLLDIGCGRGLRLLGFRDRGFTVEGMDFDSQAVKYLQQHHGIAAVCTDLENLEKEFPKGAYDLVTAFHVIEHAPDPLALLGQCFRLLKPGGRFVAAVPLLDCVQAGWFGDRWLPVTEAPRHLTLPSREGIRWLCRRAGFEGLVLGADSTLNSAGVIGASVIPDAAITNSYGPRRIEGLIKRLLGGLVALASIPLCWLENEVLRRPSLGIFSARRPVSAPFSGVAPPCAPAN